MCLIVFAWKVVPGLPFIACANRDELYDRATAPAGSWPEHPQVYAGRDLQAGGSWMGIAELDAKLGAECQPGSEFDVECERGADSAPASAVVRANDQAPPVRFAAITNVRNPQDYRADAPSRGALVADFLAGSMTAPEYIASIAAANVDYNGYNLLLGDREALYWYSNRGQGDARNGQPLPPGIYGLSNGLLDAPWPKVLKTKAQFASLLCQGAPDDAYFEMLGDTARAPDSRLPDTGVPLDLERQLSAVCIETPGYGTRTSTVVRVYDHGPAQLHELLIQ